MVGPLASHSLLVEIACAQSAEVRPYPLNGGLMVTRGGAVSRGSGRWPGLTGSWGCVRRTTSRVSPQRAGGERRVSPLPRWTDHLAPRDRAHDDRPAVQQVGLVPVDLALHPVQAGIERGHQVGEVGRLATLVDELASYPANLCPGGVSLRRQAGRDCAQRERGGGKNNDDYLGQHRCSSLIRSRKVAASRPAVTRRIRRTPQQALVDRVVREYDGGSTWQAIADRLNEVASRLSEAGQLGGCLRRNACTTLTGWMRKLPRARRDRPDPLVRTASFAGIGRIWSAARSMAPSPQASPS